MKRLTIISFLVVVICSGCSSIYSPYDLYDWCVSMGSTRLASVGSAQAHDPSVCQQQLDEDLVDQTPRFLYIPKDLIAAPIITARAIWTLFSMTTPPF
jgi:hypothetical protein